MSEIPQEGLEKEFELPVTLEEGGAGHTAHVKMRAVRFGTRVIVDGRAEMGVSMSCSRCLKEFPHRLETDFRDEYLPFTVATGGGEHELKADEMDTGFYADDEIDVNELIKEQLLLVVPMKRLCVSECRGLCPICGTDLNQGECGCAAEEPDPRFAKLSGLKERLKK
ncbi:MAG: DUF177 domain-containing protein [Nitrospirae bacterium]|nr:DUF177 domain-containing protein [Nitrospirota bacterium]